MGAPITPERTATFDSTTGTAKPMAGAVLQMPIGNVRVSDLPGLTTTMVIREDPRETRIAIIAYGAPVPGEACASGYAVQLTPAIVRSIAASLLRLANILDPQAVH